MRKLIYVLLLVLSTGAAGYSANYHDALGQAQKLVKSGDGLGAATLLEQALGHDVNDEAEWLRGAILIWRSAPDRTVLAQFLKVADTFPSSPNAALALVRVGHLRDKLGEDSSPDWERVVRDHPHTKAAAVAMHCLGHCALRKHDPASAIKLFKDAMSAPEADPVSAADSRVEAGYACISQYWKTKDTSYLGDGQELLLPLAASSELVLPVVRAHLALAEIYLIRGEGEAAAREYKTAVAARPANAYLFGIAEFGLGSALYAKRDFAAADVALTKFLEDRTGATLAQKEQSWKNARPGYAAYCETDPARALVLSGLDLVQAAAYWRAASLVELKRYREAKAIVDELQGFASLKHAKRVENLRKICAHNIGEDK